MVYRIEIKGPISKPLEYIVRRALKEAIEQHVPYVVMEMDTPGGDGEVMFSMMEMIRKFPGKVITYVNDEAISAGALIAFVSDEVYFDPVAVIGASAPVTATGGEINPTLQAKLLSYIRARIRALKDEDPLAANVLEAMVDINYELVVDEKVISPAGELLTLSASEASEFYLDPPRRLLGNGIVESLDQLLAQSLEGQEYQLIHFEKTWSEQLALYTNTIAPILFGLGIFLIILEFKTPGFGLPGIIGISLLVLTLLGQNAAGLAGHETILIILVGFILIGIEIFVLPGTFVFLVLGLVAVFGGLVYAMADIWPQEAIDTTITVETFMRPLRDTLLAFLIGGVALFLLLRNMRGSWFGRMFVLEASAGQILPADSPQSAAALIGKIGVTITPMRPNGEVEIEGTRYQAESHTPLDEGTRIRVVAQKPFRLEVEVAS